MRGGREGDVELRRISAILSRLADHADRSAQAIHQREHAAPPPPPSSPDLSRAPGLDRTASGELDLVEALFAERRRRDKVFAKRNRLLGEPAWDILLYLYIGFLRQWAVSIVHATQASGVPATSALRCIGRLERDGLVLRAADVMDRRRTLLMLTDDARNLLKDYVQTLRLTAERSVGHAGL